MENYLTGRAGVDNLKVSDGNSSFRPFLSQTESPSNESPLSEIDLNSGAQSEVIFDEKDCPKVEVLSVDKKPRQILIHLEDGRLLKINCEYGET